MPLYEHVLLARQDITTQQVETLVQSVDEIVKKNGGQVCKTEMWGLRNLAYKIKKYRKAHYALMDIDAPAGAIFEMERQLKLNENVIRFLTVRVDKHEEGPSVVMQKRERDEQRKKERELRELSGQEGDNAFPIEADEEAEVIEDLISGNIDEFGSPESSQFEASPDESKADETQPGTSDSSPSTDSLEDVAVKGEESQKAAATDSESVQTEQISAKTENAPASQSTETQSEQSESAANDSKSSSSDTESADIKTESETAETTSETSENSESIGDSKTDESESALTEDDSLKSEEAKEKVTNSNEKGEKDV